MGAEVDRDKDSAVTDLKNLKLVATTGDETQPTIAADVTAAEVSFVASTEVDPKTGKPARSRPLSCRESLRTS